jgi:putative ABC transport system substrate-binding protein
MGLHPFETLGANDLDRALLAKRRVSAVVIPDDTLCRANTAAILGLAARNRAAASPGRLAFAEASGSMGYQQSIMEVHRQSAIFLERILKGAKPADLPIEQPTRFERVINLKTAKAIGLTIPPLLARADEVIQ